MSKSIKAIDKTSVHRITSGQVVIDLQTAVKELLENSIDAGATSVEIRFKQYGLKGVEVVDNGSGIAEEDHGSIALKHHTSKLASFSDLTSVCTFGFRGEALSSLCALSQEVTVCTATSSTKPMGVCLIMDSSGKITKRSTVARQQGTTVTLTNLFSPLPVRRKELERNIKREFGKALSLLTAYALGPCSAGSGVRLTVTNQLDKGPKTTQIKTLGAPSCRTSVTALWGPKSLDNIIDMNLEFKVEREKAALKRLQSQESEPISIHVKGLISKFGVGFGRSGTDRQFFYINGRPCNLSKIQKAFNEVYRTFNATQAPFIVADFIVPTESYDVNVSPDKRTILLHNEGNLLSSLKTAIENHFAPSRATYDLGGGTQKNAKSGTQTLLAPQQLPKQNSSEGIANKSVAENELSPLTSDATSPPAPPTKAPSLNINQHTEATAPNTDPMDVDDDVQELSDQQPSIVLDTSQTRWARQLAATPHINTPPSEHTVVTADSTTADEGPKKKQKSDVPPSMATLIMDDEDPDEQEAYFTATSSTKLAVVSASARTQPSTKVAKPILKSTSKSVARKNPTGANPRASLRSQIASFARPGSQPAVATLEDEIVENPRRMDDESDEEEDELAGDDNDGPKLVGGSRLLSSSPLEPATGSSDTSNLNKSAVPNSVPVNVSHDEPIIGEDDEIEDDPTSILSQARASSSTTPSTISLKDKIQHPEVIRSEKIGGDISLRVDLNKIKRAWSHKVNSRLSGTQSESSTANDTVPTDAGVSNLEDQDKAASALARVIDKVDFVEMDIVGQFNLGFIVVRRRKAGQDMGAMDDLFIVDQHAADEKYNFETLQATTKIDSQKLFRPQGLELTASDELLALENIDVLRQNGFEIDIDEEGAVGRGSKLKLTAQPVSKNTVFNMKDLEELIHLLRDRPGGQMVRCSKARAMFAMRACRKSVMIGMPLTQQQMTSVVRHMGTMDQPWNCPHGRPTMRHLTDMRKSIPKTKEAVDWASFGS